MKKKWLYQLLKLNIGKNRCQYTSVGFSFGFWCYGNYANTTAATIIQNTMVQMLTTHFRSIQWLQIEFGDQKIFLIEFQPRLQAIREPESILLAKGFFIYGDKIAKSTNNNTRPSNIVTSSFLCMETCFIIIKLQQILMKKSKLCKICS